MNTKHTKKSPTGGSEKGNKKNAKKKKKTKKVSRELRVEAEKISPPPSDKVLETSVNVTGKRSNLSTILQNFAPLIL